MNFVFSSHARQEYHCPENEPVPQNHGDHDMQMGRGFEGQSFPSHYWRRYLVARVLSGGAGLEIWLQSVWSSFAGAQKMPFLWFPSIYIHKFIYKTKDI